MSGYFDVVVAGAGPAGLATAIHARKAGFEVLVIDPHGAQVIDKACGEGIMPGGVEALKRIGVRPQGRPFMGIRYVLATDPTCEAFGNFPYGPGLGVRRTTLSQALLDRAIKAGVRFQEGQVTAFSKDADGVTLPDGTEARWLVAADGLRSPIRRYLGLDLRAKHPRRFALRRHYARAPWSMHVEVHLADGAEAYVTPVADDCVGVALLYHDGDASAAGGIDRYDELLGRFPHLEERLRLVRPASTVRGAGPFEQRVARRVDGPVLLVGDAAGYLDPLTGEGIALGVATAEAAVLALQADDAASYEARYHALTRRYFAITAGVLTVVRHPSLHRAFIKTAHALPHTFDAALGAISQLDESRRHTPLMPEAPIV